MTDHDAPVGRRPAAQPTAPYLEAVTAYGFRGSTRFHTPGHKGGEGADRGLASALGPDALLLDIPLDIEGVDKGPKPTPYERAECLAADAYGAKQAWFLTNGATQGNHALCLALAPPGSQVLIQRNSHASIIDGLVLSGGLPSFVSPEYDPELGMAHGVTPEALADALERCPQARAAFIVSPTYYGMAADVGGAPRSPTPPACRWSSTAPGARTSASTRACPRRPLRLGADAMLASTHKIVGSLTQSAMLHVSDSGRVDPARSPAVRLVRSTSPSSLLMASLDAARRQLAVHGEALLDRTIAARRRRGPRSVRSPAARSWGSDSSAGPGSPAGIRCGSSRRPRNGLHGLRGRRGSARVYDIYVELATHATIVLVLGIAPAGRAARAFRPRSRRDDPPDFARRRAAGHRDGRRPRCERDGVPPRDAFLGRSEAVPVDEAIGRISCESIAGYPPGVPSLLPGERVTAR